MVRKIHNLNKFFGLFSMEWEQRLRSHLVLDETSLGLSLMEFRWSFPLWSRLDGHNPHWRGSFSLGGFQPFQFFHLRDRKHLRLLHSVAELSGRLRARAWLSFWVHLVRFRWGKNPLPASSFFEWGVSCLLRPSFYANCHATANFQPFFDTLMKIPKFHVYISLSEFGVSLFGL